MLSPDKSDPNRRKEQERKKKELDSFGRTETPAARAERQRREQG